MYVTLFNRILKACITEATRDLAGASGDVGLQAWSMLNS